MLSVSRTALKVGAPRRLVATRVRLLTTDGTKDHYKIVVVGAGMAFGVHFVSHV